MSLPKVLFVDDEPRIVRLLSMLFRHEFDVLTATGGNEAIELVRQHDLHVIVSDQRMPRMTGIQLLSKVREISPRTVRILLTGYSDLVAIIGAINDGEVYRFLNKPWNEDELLQTVREASAIATAHRQDEAGDLNADRQQASIVNATKLLSIDGVGKDKREIIEIFTDDFQVISANSLSGALDELRQHDIGVVVAEFDTTSEDAINLCTTIRDSHPNTVVVLLAKSTDSETVVRLINEGNIYRFGMRPLSPNVFRLAVGAALKEHQRRLARVRIADAHRNDVGSVEDAAGRDDLAIGIKRSLARFTDTW